MTLVKVLNQTSVAIIMSLVGNAGYVTTWVLILPISLEAAF